MGQSPRSSPGDPGHLKGFGLGEGMPALWPTSSRVQLQVVRPWPQEYEPKHQNLLSQQEGRLQGAWRNVVVVFLLLAHYARVFSPPAWRGASRGSEWCRGPCVFSIVVMVLSMASF